MVTVIGNIRWCSPEVVKESPFSAQSDMWSYGMTCLELLSGNVPYSEIDRDISVLRAIDKGKLPNRPRTGATLDGLSDSVWALLQLCWQIEPKSRPPTSAVKAALQKIRGGDSHWYLMICV